MNTLGCRSASAFAPASVANVAVGFDILGFSLDALGDTVTVSRMEKKGIVIRNECPGQLPTDPAKNTATAGILQMMEDFNLTFGFEVRIQKGIPVASGLGGSAASAVGGVVAASAFLPVALKKEDQLKYALIGESVASGAVHADNVGPCLYGGLTLVKSSSANDIVSLPVPSGVMAVVVHPHMEIETREARRILKPHLSLQEHVTQSASLAGFIAGCFRDDLSLIQSCLRDSLIEPQRRRLIPGFAQVQKAAMDAGALGCSISGSGPSVFAWVPEGAAAGKAQKGMLDAFARQNLMADSWVSALQSAGARIVRREES